jgi:hypothetical protein
MKSYRFDKNIFLQIYINIEEYFLKKWIGQFFLFFFPSDIRFSKKIPVNQLIKKKRPKEGKL